MFLSDGGGKDFLLSYFFSLSLWDSSLEFELLGGIDALDYVFFSAYLGRDFSVFYLGRDESDTFLSLFLNLFKI